MHMQTATGVSVYARRERIRCGNYRALNTRTHSKIHAYNANNGTVRAWLLCMLTTCLHIHTGRKYTTRYWPVPKNPRDTICLVCVCVCACVFGVVWALSYACYYIYSHICGEKEVQARSEFVGFAKRTGTDLYALWCKVSANG